MKLVVAGPQGETTATIVVETGQRLRVEVEDYNFDGHEDFGISHGDDGMGTYRIYQVCVYSTGEARFVPLLPQCGDEFINLRLEKAQRILINSYIEDNRYRTCTMTF